MIWTKFLDGMASGAWVLGLILVIGLACVVIGIVGLVLSGALSEDEDEDEENEGDGYDEVR